MVVTVHETSSAWKAVASEVRYGAYRMLIARALRPNRLQSDL